MQMNSGFDSSMIDQLLETAEEASLLDSQRAEESLNRGKKRLKDTTMDLQRAQKAMKRAKNRIQIIKIPK